MEYLGKKYYNAGVAIEPSMDDFYVIHTRVDIAINIFEVLHEQDNVIILHKQHDFTTMLIEGILINNHV